MGRLMPECRKKQRRRRRSARCPAATALASRYGLKAADATHLATAVAMGADRFVTNNQRDFPATIAEVGVTYPADLAEAP